MRYLAFRASVRLLATLSFALATLFVQPVFSADDGKRGFVEKVFKDESGDHRYAVFVPPSYSPSKAWPVILFLHGAGERGTDGKVHLNIGLGSLVKAREATFPAIVVFPQCENTRGRLLEGWLAGNADANRALRILEQVEKDFKIDPKRRILSGWSMGGFGAWSIAAADPARWSALVAIAGGGNKEWAEKLKDLPTWTWHGTNDGAVNVNRSREMVEAIKAVGGSPRYTEIADGDHDSWKMAFADDRLFAWMLDPKNVDPEKLPAPKELLLPKLVVADPFIPESEISNALYARLGNQALEAIAYSAPKQIPANALRGQINDIVDFTNVDGYGFRIQFSGITYTSQLNQVRLKAHAKDRLNVQVALSKAVLNIGGTWVTGEDHAAQAGPIQVVIGHARPVWLSVDVQPYVENRRLRLRQIGARFEIPNDNWYVTAPAGVSVQGFGMSREKVSSGLVSGLYGSKARIESEVLGAVPTLLDTVEKKLAEFGEANDFAARFWPLPVYRPRVKLWPQAVSTDENGVTVTMGLTAAAIDSRKAPKKPLLIELKPDPLTDLPNEKSLQVGLTPDLLEPLTELLIQADVARVPVLDIPENTFAKFADKEVLSKAIPELKRHTDAAIWSELSLASPLQVKDVAKMEGEKEGATRVQFQIPKLFITTSLFEPGQPTNDPRLAKPFAVFEVQLKQSAFAELTKPDSQTRAIRFGWDGEPQLAVTGRFAEGYEAQDKTIHNDVLESLLKDCWKAWTGLTGVSSVRVPDLDFGLSKLRLSNAGWDSPHVFATFTPPGVKLTNSSKEVFVYETKGLYSDWSAPFKLEPGKSHEFELSFPLTYRRNGEVYTLFPGSHSEFREPLKGGPPRLFQAREE